MAGKRKLLCQIDASTLEGRYAKGQRFCCYWRRRPLATALMFLTPSPAGLAQRQGDTPTVISPIRTPTRTPMPRATPTVYNIEPITDAAVWLALHGRYRQQEAPDATREPEHGECAPQRAPDAPFTYVMPLALNDYSLRNVGWKGFGLGSGIPVDVAAMKIAWYDSWGPNETRLPEPEFLPMVWCADKGGENHSGEVHWSPAAVADRARRFPGRIWLIYNEPDFPASPNRLNATPTGYYVDQCREVLCQMVNDQWGTVTPVPTPGTGTPSPGTPTPTFTPAYLCGWSITTPTPANYDQLVMKTAQLAADRYAEIYKVIKKADPSASVYCCGAFFTREGPTDWWNEFIARLKAEHPDVTIDGVHPHVYGWSGSTGNDLDVGKACGRTTAFGDWWDTCLKKNLTGYWDNVHNCASADCDLTRGKPLLITEYGYLGGPNTAMPSSQTEVRNALMTPIAGFFTVPGENPGYTGIAWFVSASNSPNTPLLTFLFQFTPTPTYMPTVTLTATTLLGGQWRSYTTPTPTRWP